jgi:hypothetical protein
MLPFGLKDTESTADPSRHARIRMSAELLEIAGVVAASAALTTLIHRGLQSLVRPRRLRRRRFGSAA